MSKAKRLKREAAKRSQPRPSEAQVRRVKRSSVFTTFGSAEARHPLLADNTSDLYLLAWMMEHDDLTVARHFCTLNGATSYDVGLSAPVVFVPGTRPDPACLVAHLDTVFTQPGRLAISDDADTIYSRTPSQGIGADDRAGCAALWSLADTGHSLLLVPDEEVGCLGSAEVVERNLIPALRDHRLFIQFDRRGDNDFIFYNGEPEPLRSLLKPYFPTFSTGYGSFSDISVLCPGLGVAGVNLSIGYHLEHTAYETLEVSAWQRTVAYARAFLSQPMPERIPYVTSHRPFGTFGRYAGVVHGGYDDAAYESYYAPLHGTRSPRNPPPHDLGLTPASGDIPLLPAAPPSDSDTERAAFLSVNDTIYQCNHCGSIYDPLKSVDDNHPGFMDAYQTDMIASRQCPDCCHPLTAVRYCPRTRIYRPL